MLSNKWWKLLLIITLVYPFIWLYKRFSSSGGGKWEVCGGAYALKAWRPIAQHPDGSSGSAKRDLQTGDASGRVVETAEGARLQLLGTREGEWFQRWEGLIRQAVRERRISDAPIVSPEGRTADQPVIIRLDGYRPYEREI